MKSLDIISEFEKRDYRVKIKLGSVESETKLKCGRNRTAILLWEGKEIYMGYLACAIEEGKIEAVFE